MEISVILIIVGVLVLINIILTFLNRKKDSSEELKNYLVKIESWLSRSDNQFREESLRNREENQKSFRENRDELSKSLKSFEDRFSQNVKEIRETVESKLKTINEENVKKLDEMRKVVDEKLQESLEKRFSQSFKLISERLEQVHKGLGEMQTLASGVGDLKKVLTNVKTRGTLGEIQLGAILEQILSPEQYQQNATVKKDSQERVEYVVKLPDKNSDDKSVLLPIDSKFPTEDYQRLLDAYENVANISQKEMDSIFNKFENSLKKNAKDIREKYINPPVTTDFAIMFVPTEGLYAEVLRRPGLFETLQREYKVSVVGPTNLVAFLSSLQMGFRTLAIEKRSSEVWEVLGAVKTQFGKFGDILDKTRKKLQEATNVIEDAGTRSRAIEKKLKTVQKLSKEEATALIGEAVEVDKDDEN